ncbi:LuxR family transcriptional regulator [Rhizobium sp. NTR19]|uniref:LuxR family transcriptional regulator n=1 Tax=Neorhizobium turbinariae TaxID=2937795 RepID=A0ABT0IU48_9HYPH|nr:LuxR family transcriptional regulator [Neorhizobium turbinariae]MCK8781402.1 LuxR family transcriptional regulator [Neorhizobium turbinariae]
MSIQLIVQFLVLVEETKTEAELIAQLESVLKPYGFEYYSIRLHSRQHQNSGHDVLAAHWPEDWEENYASRRYPIVDPTVRMLGIAQRPFRWRDAVLKLKTDPNRARMQRMMQDAARNGLLDGYTFPVQGRNGLLGHVTICGKVVDLSPAEVALFDAAARKVFWRFLELRERSEELEAVPQLETRLTRREMEVIVLLADGLTSNEIAKALEISSHTVDWYINGLQEKLKAKNRQHVVASAFRLGLTT